MPQTSALGNGAQIQVCDCGTGYNNTGVGCQFLRAVEKRAWIQSLYNSAGVLNYIDLTAPITNTIINGLLYNTDGNIRVYPFPETKNIEDVADDTKTEEAKDGTVYYVREGIRKFKGELFPDSASPQFKAIIDNIRCMKAPGKYVVDANNTIWGIISDDGTKLYPMPIDPQSVWSKMIYATDGSVVKLDYGYNYHPSFDDRKVRGIAQNQLTGGWYPLTINGLLGVSGYVISSSAGSKNILITLFDNFGNPLDPEIITGLLLAAFALKDITTNAAVTLTAVTESPAGTYKLVWTASGVTAADVLQLTLTLANGGYDFTTINAMTFIAGT